ncbi:penicillin-binding protein activator LpoB [Rhodocytophaga aerolata]|uniref:Penicillin-binding protein activator LpoB n=1 Tax=Rhodocytophaga aerolata TaxID=455078 RepID=A0ABT8R9D0_9BACT|nr:penicillin-binding protein activator LpoB [Rhodocytophaga aerolata]MDO1448687.1 penicillin-binding protein activator LpoB [Rhodocytophaga aerolata]
MKTIIKLSSIALFLIIFASCAKRTVTRVSPDQQIDLSGRWNDTDSRLVAEEMVKDAINRAWRSDFVNKTNKKPVMIVGVITNKSHEHIEAETFVKNMEREFINSSTVRVVQNAEFREKMRQERADQQEFASPDTQKKWGRELGADYMMFGNINSIVDAINKKQVTYYQVNLELVDLETNEKVWIGEKQIKKYITN